MSYASLRRQMHYRPELLVAKDFFNAATVAYIPLNKLETRLVTQGSQPGILQSLVVKGIQVINPRYFVPHLQEPLSDMRADEPCTTREQYSFCPQDSP